MRLVGLHRLQPHSDNCYNDNETSSQCFHKSRCNQSTALRSSHCTAYG
jgi:hypothetical protein